MYVNVPIEIVRKICSLQVAQGAHREIQIKETYHHSNGQIPCFHIHFLYFWLLFLSRINNIMKSTRETVRSTINIIELVQGQKQILSIYRTETENKAKSLFFSDEHF